MLSLDNSKSSSPKRMPKRVQDNSMIDKSQVAFERMVKNIDMRRKPRQIRAINSSFDVSLLKINRVRT